MTSLLLKISLLLIVKNQTLKYCLHKMIAKMYVIVFVTNYFQNNYYIIKYFYNLLMFLYVIKYITSFFNQIKKNREEILIGLRLGPGRRAPTLHETENPVGAPGKSPASDQLKPCSGLAPVYHAQTRSCPIRFLF